MLAKDFKDEFEKGQVFIVNEPGKPTYRATYTGECDILIADEEVLDVYRNFVTEDGTMIGWDAQTMTPVPPANAAE